MDCSQQLIVECLSWVLAGTLENLPLKHTKRAADSQEGRREGDRVGGSVDEPSNWIPVLPASPAPALFPASGPIWL